MLFRKYIVSTRTLFQLTVVMAFFLVSVGAALAANSGNPPVLIPYTNMLAAGDDQYYGTSTSLVTGYGGDAGQALPFFNGTAVQPGGTLSSPYAVAVDSVDNIYITDTNNDLIREINYDTGVINTIAGQVPGTCTSGSSGAPAVTCALHYSGCADGVPAFGSRIGSKVEGIAVDSFGNVYFVDQTTATVSVIYRGGTRVADFINRVNPAGVANSPGGVVTPGYVYHVAGAVNLTTCGGSTGRVDNGMAFTNTASGAAPTATLGGSVGLLTLDSAGNIYVSDYSNATVRVINTQETAQTFFQFTVPAGYMRSITNCNANLTAPCPPSTNAQYGTGINGPVDGLVYSGGSSAPTTTDAYGNIYQTIYKGANLPGIYLAITYAGGTPLTNLLTVESYSLNGEFGSAFNSNSANPAPDLSTPEINELPLVYGSSYIGGGNPPITSTLPGGIWAILATASQGGLVIRPTAAMADLNGAVWYSDNHYPELSRIDPYTQDAIGVFVQNANGGHRSTANITPSMQVTNTGNTVGFGNAPSGAAWYSGLVANYQYPASLYSIQTSPKGPNPWMCLYGNLGAGYPWSQGPMTYNPLGDGCPAALGLAGNLEDNMVNDGLNNMFVMDNSNAVLHELTVGTVFPATPVGNTPVNQITPNGQIQTAVVTQAIQVHFDGGIPVNYAGNPPTSPGNPPAGLVSAGFFASAPGFTTTAFSIVSPTNDFSIDTTDAEFPLGSLITPQNEAFGNSALTPNFFMWAGLPTCTQLGISGGDVGYDCLVYVSFTPTAPGLRQALLVATTVNGSKYYFPLQGIGQAPQLAIDGGQQTVVRTTGLGANPTAIATDAQADIYIADTANSKILIECSSTGPTAPLPGCAALTGGATQAVLTLNFPAGTTPTSLKGPMGVAVDAADNVYISDTGNNRILKVSATTNAVQVLGNYVWVPGANCDGGVTPAASNCPSVVQTTVGGTTESVAAALPQDYIAGATSPTTPPPQYAFNAPQGLAVDQWGNVYVADTGNAAVVEIPSNFALGGATPLLQYAGAPTFTKPVAVAIGPYIGSPGTALLPASPTNQNVYNGYVFVADQGNPDQQIIRIPPGGGDLQRSTGQAQGAQGVIGLDYTTFVQITSGPDTPPEFGGGGITEPNGVAVDSAGNVYVSDGTGNAVWEAPAVAANGAPFTLSFSGLNNPAGLALDPSGNVYVADSGNNRILEMPRANPVVPFGTVPQDLIYAPPFTGSGVAGTPVGCPITGGSVPCTGVLTVTNIGNTPATLTSPFLGAVSNSEFTISSTCTSPLPVGTTCTISPQFLPTSDGAASSNVTVNGAQSIALTANGANPEINLVLSSSLGLTPAFNSTPVITATATQPHIANTTPAGTVTFTYTLNSGTYLNSSCGAGGSSAAIPLVAGANNTATASFTLPALSGGVSYIVSATYNPTDAVDGITNASPLTLKVAPSVVETATAASVTYTYGQTLPTIAGTVSPALPTGVTATFKAGAYPNYATSCSPAAAYPITVEFAGPGACGYGFPTVTNSGSGGGLATATETQAPLTVSFANPVTTVYGAADYNFNSVLQYVGASTVCGDINRLSATFSTSNAAPPPTPPAVHTSVLDVVPASPAVNPFPIYATVVGKPITAGDYKVTYSSGTDTITPAPSSISVTAANTQVAMTTAGVSSATFAITVSTLVTVGKGTPTGTVSVTDNFVPITTTSFVPTPTAGWPVVNGAIVFPSTVITIPPCSATVTTNCNPIVTLGSGTAAPGTGTFTLPNILTITGTASTVPACAVGATCPEPGTHYLSFAYSGDAVVGGVTNGDGKGDFACSVLGTPATATCPTAGTVPNAVIVDYPDYFLTSTSGLITVVPGDAPNGSGLPPGPQQNGSFPETAIIQLNSVLKFATNVNLSCQTQNPTWVNCFMYASGGGTTQAVPSNGIVASVLAVSTPATLPLGFNFGTAELRTSATRTVLAFLPFGVLAFCVRRRRMLSKALWVLIAVAAVSVGVSGCGGNQVDFYTPIPTGPQTVTVTASFIGNTATPAESRTYVVPINID
jgi:serine/threonine-protein kinase